MSKIKELWRKNKIAIVFMFILLICLIAIIIVSFTFFFGGNKSTYGERLKDIDKYPVTEEFQNDYISSLESEAEVNKVTFKTMGKNIYIHITFKDDTSLTTAESKATASLEKFDKELLKYYDIDFTIDTETKGDEGFVLMGAKNAIIDNISWNNNTKVESE